MKQELTLSSSNESKTHKNSPKNILSFKPLAAIVKDREDKSSSLMNNPIPIDANSQAALESQESTTSGTNDDSSKNLPTFTEKNKCGHRKERNLLDGITLEKIKDPNLCILYQNACNKANCSTLSIVITKVLR